nr:protein TRACHEARY ELEMENT DIFFERENTIATION-RELATED 7-like [Aegilops tauschii subsp. strangulata]
MDITDTLQEGMVAPAGVTASEPKTGKDFSRTPIPTAQRTGANQPNRRPPPCAIAVAPPPTPPHCEHPYEAKRTGEKRPAEGEAAPKPNGREPPPPPSCGRPEPPAPSR